MPHMNRGHIPLPFCIKSFPLRFAADVKDMTGQSLSIYWSITLRFVAPVLIVVVLVASIAMRAINGVSYPAYDALDVSS